MTLIEGVGDEVTQFFVLVAIIAVGLIAWWSTSIADQPLIRTVLILERRTRHRVTTESPPTPTTTNSSHDNSIDTGQAEPQSSANENQQEIEGGTACRVCDNETASMSSPNDAANSSQSLSNDQNWELPEISNNSTNEQLQSTTSIESGRSNDSHFDEDDIPAVSHITSSAVDTEPNLLRSRRIAFFQSRQVTLLDSPVTDGLPVSTSCSAESDNVDKPDSIRQPRDPPVIASDSSEDLPTTGSIRIRLKYLNDDQKLVEGRLHEQLGDFKRRHFGIELAADKLVRLIFNGQVLQSDSETLQGYGLFDNCVVHCLVHQQRSGSTNRTGINENQSTRDSATGSSSATDAAPHRDWDLGNVLFASVSLLLGLAWYLRYQYAQLFNATTTVALVGLTGILTVSFVGMYLPDQDGIPQ